MFGLDIYRVIYRTVCLICIPYISLLADVELTSDLIKKYFPEHKFYLAQQNNKHFNNRKYAVSATGEKTDFLLLKWISDEDSMYEQLSYLQDLRNNPEKYHPLPVMKENISVELLSFLRKQQIKINSAEQAEDLVEILKQLNPFDSFYGFRNSQCLSLELCNLNKDPTYISYKENWSHSAKFENSLWKVKYLVKPKQGKFRGQIVLQDIYFIEVDDNGNLSSVYRKDGFSEFSLGNAELVSVKSSADMEQVTCELKRPGVSVKEDNINIDSLTVFIDPLPQYKLLGINAYVSLTQTILFKKRDQVLYCLEIGKSTPIGLVTARRKSTDQDLVLFKYSSKNASGDLIEYYYDIQGESEIDIFIEQGALLIAE